MGYSFYTIVIGITAITPVLAAFKDFVIENEKDLQCFGASDENMLYDDDELVYDDFGDQDIFNVIGSKCEVADNALPSYKGSIDERVFREIMHHLANAADFDKLQNYMDNYQGFKDMLYENHVDDLETDGDDTLFLQLT